MILEFDVNGQIITPKIPNPIVAGIKEMLLAKFNFLANAEDWSTLYKTAYFSNGAPSEYNKPKPKTIEDGMCKVPWEVLVKPGLVYVGLGGVDGLEELPSNYTCFELLKGVTFESEEASEPTQSLISEMWDVVNEAKELAENIEGGTGADGKSAYEVWLDNGHTGTEADFLLSLKGELGPKGDKGDKGDQGDVGPQGPPGSSSEASQITKGIEVRTTRPTGEDLFNGRIYALIESGNTAPSAPVISQSSVGDNTITIQLTTASTDAEDGAITKYNAYKGGVLYASDITLAQGGTYQFTGLISGTSYDLTLKAKDSLGSLSASSNTVSVTTTGGNTAPTVPTGLASSNITSSGFTLSWSASTDAQGNSIAYKVYKDGTLYQSGVTATNLAVTGQTSGSSATWTVSATDGSLESVKSAGLIVVINSLVIDKQNPESNSDTQGFTIMGTANNSASGWTKGAVSFIPTVNKPIDKISLFGRYRSDVNASATADVRVRIETDNAGKPSGTLAHATLVKSVSSDINSVAHEMVFDFDSTFTPTVGAKYWIVIDIANASSTGGVYYSFKTSPSGSYTGDSVFATWSDSVYNLQAYDICFVEYIVP